MPDRNSLVAAAREAAARYGLDPAIFVRQIDQESGFNPRAISPAGAQGIAQFMPGTARGVGLKDPFEPVSALDASAKHMAALLRNLGSYPLALAGYNAGAGAVQKYGGIPPYKETQNYVRAILGNLDPSTAGRTPSPSSSPIPTATATEQPADRNNGMALAVLSLLSDNSRITPYEQLIQQRGTA